MEDFIISGKIISVIIQASFQNSEYHPEENLALLNVSKPFIQEMLNASDISDKDKRFLLSIKDKLRLKSNEAYMIKTDSENMDFSQWFPEKTYSYFQKEAEQCSFFITNPNDDLKIGQGSNYVSWVSLSNLKIDMTSVHPSKRCENITVNKWGLSFDGTNLYQIEGIGIRAEGSVCICMTFYVRDVKSQEEKFILYERDDETGNTRGVSIFKKNLRIWGVNTIEKYCSISEVSKDVWTTVFIEYPALGESNPGRYFIGKSKSGEFNIPDFEGIEDMHIYVGGGTPELESSRFNGVLASLDIFYRNKNVKLPKHLIDLIINKHIISTDDA